MRVTGDNSAIGDRSIYDVICMQTVNLEQRNVRFGTAKCYNRGRLIWNSEMLQQGEVNLKQRNVITGGG